MTLLIALLLGIVQGLFMFVPVSSTSHLVLTQTLLLEQGADIPPSDSPEMILFDLVVHVGTLVSVVIVMGDGLKELGAGVRGELADGTLRREGLAAATSTKLVLLGLLSVAVTGVLGLTFQDVLSGGFGSLPAVAGSLVGTGALRAVLRLLEAARLRIFALYVWILAAVVLVMRLGSSRCRPRLRIGPLRAAGARDGGTRS